MSDYYTENAAKLCKAYDAVIPSDLYAPRLKTIHLLRKGGLALDVGSGSGRDAAWLSSMGFSVVAAEPNEAMRDHARKFWGERIEWTSAALPGLVGIPRPDRGYDLIMCNAVMMHVPPVDRALCIETLYSLLSRDGVVILNFRNVTPDDQGRAMFPVTEAEMTVLALDKGFDVHLTRLGDKMGRAAHTWTSMEMTVRRTDR